MGCAEPRQSLAALGGSEDRLGIFQGFVDLEQCVDPHHLEGAANTLIYPHQGESAAVFTQLGEHFDQSPHEHTGDVANVSEIQDDIGLAC